MKRFFTLLKNELRLSIRDMNMVIFGIIMPLAVYVVLGIIYRSKPAYEGADYTFLEQSFGAVCAVSVCAGGLMGLPLVVSDSPSSLQINSQKLWLSPVNTVFPCPR